MNRSLQKTPNIPNISASTQTHATGILQLCTVTMTGKENLTSVTTGAPPSRHKFPSNKAASAQVTHNFSMQLAEGQTFPNVSKRLLPLKAFSQLYHSTIVFF